MEQSWKTDPRLKKMDPQKLELLILFSNRLDKMPKGQLLSDLLELNLEAQKKGIQFTDQETGLITEILTENLPDHDKKKLDMLRLLSRKFSSDNTQTK